jgi:non-homologous end joining protein Ku
MPEYEVGYEEVLPEGVYPFVCINANEKTSQSGNVMIELELMVKGPNSDNEIRVFDHLVFARKSTWKIDDFRIATGETLIKGQKASFEAEDCLDRTGKVLLKIEKYEGRERNKVEEYLDPAAEKSPPRMNASFQAPARPQVEKSLEQEFKEKGGDDEDEIEIPMT